MTRLAVLLAASCALAPSVADEPTLKPDPPAKKIGWPAAVPAFEIPGSAYPTLLLADHGGPYVLVSNYTGKQTARAVYDLRTGKKVGGWKSENPATAAHALSPDGQFYVELLSRSQPVPGGAP
ncbi:MAG TPA: hypothetical protein VFG68_23130, partial [Fimbriiglobus sp.]|nr:hypothetical protein [Fimbriiglobus sp.]